MASLTCSIPTLLRADVIHLKNGRQIIADSAREDATEVHYQQGENEFAIPRRLVDHVEKTTERPQARSSHVPADLPDDLSPPSIPAPEQAARLAGGINRAELVRIDREFLRHPSPQEQDRLSRAYQQAAVALEGTGQPEDAIDICRHALKLAPEDAGLTVMLGYFLVKQGHYAPAIELLRSAEVQHDKLAEIPMLLGVAYYSSEELARAIAEWKRSLALRDDSRVRKALTKAEKELEVAGSYQELRTEHFLLRYEEQGPPELGPAVLNSLEGSFRELERDLDVYPREPIIVLLYPRTQYRDITRSPTWVGAVNDGKIRVPVSGLTEVTLELARTLKHELTHSFVNQVTQGRCPTWLNEGLAQLEEGATTAAQGSQLARLLASGGAPGLATLEGSFIDLPREKAGLAYAESLAALEFLRDTYGLSRISRLLKLMPSSPGLAALLERELRMDYPALDRAVADYVEKRYGT